MTPSSPPQQRPAASGARAWGLPLAAAAVTGLVVAPALLRRDAFLDRDMSLVYLPVWQYWRDRVLAGQFPQWYPLDGLGQPLIGLTVGGLFHPLALLVIPLGARTALGVGVLLSLFAGLLGAALLGRRWWQTAGVAELFATGYALSGYSVSMTSNLLYLVSLSTVPWVLYALDRALVERRACWLALGAALLASIALIGDALTFGFITPLAVVLALQRGSGPPLARLGLVALLFASSLGIGAIQLLPSTLTAGAAASTHNDLTAVLTWSVHPARLLEVALGPLTDNAGRRELLWGFYRTSGGDEWAASLHLGLPILTLAVVGLFRARRSPLLWGAAAIWLILVLLWLGQSGGLWALAYQWIPPFRAFRIPEKLTPVVQLGVLVAAGAGLDALARQASRRPMMRVLLTTGALALLGAALADPLTHFVLASGTPGGAAESLAASVGGQASVWAVYSLVAAAAWWFFPASRARWATAGAFAAIAIWQGWRTTQTCPATTLKPPTWVEAVRAGQTAGAWGRFASRVCPSEGGLARGLALGCGASSQVWGIASADFYLPAFSERIFEFKDNPRAYFPLGGARYLLASKAKIANAPRYQLLSSVDETLGLFEDRNARPRAWLAREVAVASRAEAARLLTSPDFNYARDGVLEGPSIPADELGWEPGTVTLTLDEPEHQVLTVDAPRPSVLLVSDAWFPGWRGAIDGAPVEVRPGNLVLRGIRVPPGRHQVELTYRQPGLLPGTLVTGLSLTALLAFVVFEARRGTRGKAQRGSVLEPK